jgi:hypothetical protein
MLEEVWNLDSSLGIWGRFLTFAGGVALCNPHLVGIVTAAKLSVDFELEISKYLGKAERYDSFWYLYIGGVRTMVKFQTAIAVLKALLSDPLTSSTLHTTVAD